MLRILNISYYRLDEVTTLLYKNVLQLHLFVITSISKKRFVTFEWHFMTYATITHF